MEWLKDFVFSFFSSLYDGFLWIVLNIVNLLEYTAYVIYDGLLTVIYSFVSAIDFSVVMFNMAASYSSLPPQLIWLINQVNLPQAFSYISIALIIRLLLNLIPAAFSRI